jgi:hypothetical protein
MCEAKFTADAEVLGVCQDCGCAVTTKYRDHRKHCRAVAIGARSSSTNVSTSHRTRSPIDITTYGVVQMFERAKAADDWEAAALYCYAIAGLILRDGSEHSARTWVNTGDMIQDHGEGGRLVAREFVDGWDFGEPDIDWMRRAMQHKLDALAAILGLPASAADISLNDARRRADELQRAIMSDDVLRRRYLQGAGRKSRDAPDEWTTMNACPPGLAWMEQCPACDAEPGTACRADGHDVFDKVHTQRWDRR